MMNTFVAVNRLKWLRRSSRSVVLNRLHEPNAMAPTAPSEKVNYGLKHVLGHHSAQRGFQEVSWGDSEQSR